MTPMSMIENSRQQTPFRLLLIVLLSALATGLGYVVLSLPLEDPGLSEQVTAKLVHSGVSNPVTAVLLNFRGYDTLLETGVLLLALVGVWSLGGIPQQRSSTRPGPVLDTLSRQLVPLLILVAPGARFSGLPLRIALVTGLGIFVAVGMVLILLGRRLLEYPPSFAGSLILLIEAAASLSIGITLAALFLGGRPEVEPRR